MRDRNLKEAIDSLIKIELVDRIETKLSSSVVMALKNGIEELVKGDRLNTAQFITDYDGTDVRWLAEEILSGNYGG